MPIVSTAKMNARQYMALGEDPPGVRLELVNGEIAVAPSPNPEHSNCDMRFRALLFNYVEQNDLGLVLSDLDTPLDIFNVRRPDVLYFSKARLHLVTPKQLTGVPDLCVEIISPSSATIDRVDKFEQYQSAGVADYWILDPIARSLEGYHMQRGEYVAVGKGRNDDVVSLPPLPKLRIPLANLWWPQTSPKRRNTRNGKRSNGH